MADFRFALLKGVPFIAAKILGPDRSFLGRFIIDTGAALTIVRTSRLKMIGLNQDHAIAPFATDSVIGREEGYRLLVPTIEVFGVTLNNFEVAAMELPEKYHIDGLIGMNLLRQFDFCIYSQHNVIRIQLRQQV